MDKMKSVGFLNPSSISSAKEKDKNTLYAEEKAALKKEFEGLGPSIDWDDPVIAAKLKAFARQVIQITNDEIFADVPNLIDLVLPTETIQPGDTFVLDELSGPAIYYGSYGASVRMSRPQFTQYTATTNLKEVGLKLRLEQIQTGKYSASQLGEYVAKLINAWKNRLLFTNTLAAMTAYSSGGSYYQAGTALGVGTMTTAIDALSDESDAKVIVGRRSAIHQLSDLSGYSNDTRREYETQGQIGTYAGIPLLKVNSFTDLDYGQVFPMVKTSLWVFSELPAGRWVQAAALRTNNEIVARNESLNLYYRWDDGVGIFHSDRIVHVGAIT
jgi:hypothetical protein